MRGTGEVTGRRCRVWSAVRGAVMGAGLAAAAALPGTATAQKVTLGAWTVDARPAGPERGCVMSAYYPADGKYLLFALTSGFFVFAISDRRWTMPDRAQFDVEVTLDGAGPYNARGVAMRPDAVVIRTPSADQWFKMIIGTTSLGVTLVGAARYQYHFTLSGAGPAFNRLFACATEARTGIAQAPGAAPQRPAAPRRAAPGAKTPEREGLADGTGFFITHAGHVLTAEHVVRDCKALKVQAVGEAASRATVIAVSKSDDLALLKAETRSAAVAPFRPAPLRLGEQVVVFGFPLQGIVSSSGNLTTGNVAALAGYRDDHRLIQFTAPVQPGNSGGPVFDLRGHVIGIVVARLGAARDAAGTIPQNINFAVKASVAQSFLEAQGIAITRGDAAADLGVADVADKARPVTVKVECLPQ